MHSFLYVLNHSIVTLRRVLSLSLLIPMTVYAHDSWIDREEGQYTLYQGHRHSAHHGKEIEPYRADVVQRFSCIDDQGKLTTGSPEKVYPVRLSMNCTLLSVNLSTGYWSKNTLETRNVPKKELSGVLKSWLSEESIILIEAWNAVDPEQNDLEKFFEKNLVIMPLSNPLMLRTGEKLSLIVMSNGKPLAGVPVIYAGKNHGKSDKNGIISIQLKQKEWQFISVRYESDLSDGHADKRVHTVTLQFKTKS